MILYVYNKYKKRTPYQLGISGDLEADGRTIKIQYTVVDVFAENDIYSMAVIFFVNINYIISSD